MGEGVDLAFNIKTFGLTKAIAHPLATEAPLHQWLVNEQLSEFSNSVERALSAPLADKATGGINRLGAVHLSVSTDPIVVLKTEPDRVDEHMAALAELALCVSREAFAGRRVGSRVLRQLGDRERG